MSSWGLKSEPLGQKMGSLTLNMNWVLSGQKTGSRDRDFRGQEMRGLKSQLTWIGYKKEQNQCER